jgi:transcriptional regulator GlxA family with amidase domain
MRNHDSAAVSHRNRIHSYAIWRLRVFSIIQTMQIKRSTHQSRLDEALAYIAGHMKERIQLGHLSEASGVSKRTLGYLFLHTYGITPMAFLKRERLRKARMLLQHADPSTTTVTSIARECGFQHMGQFSLDYKRLFGESPSATLHQHPRADRMPDRQ